MRIELQHQRPDGLTEVHVYELDDACRRILVAPQQQFRAVWGFIDPDPQSNDPQQRDGDLVDSHVGILMAGPTPR